VRTSMSRAVSGATSWSNLSFSLPMRLLVVSTRVSNFSLTSTSLAMYKSLLLLSTLRSKISCSSFLISSAGGGVLPCLVGSLLWVSEALRDVQ
jgi:hypothetical protein